MCLQWPATARARGLEAPKMWGPVWRGSWGAREARRILAELQTAEGWPEVCLPRSRYTASRPWGTRALRCSLQPGRFCGSRPRGLGVGTGCRWARTPVAAFPQVSRRSEPTRPQAAERLNEKRACPTCPSQGSTCRLDRGGDRGGASGGDRGGAGGVASGRAAPGCCHSPPALCPSTRHKLLPLREGRRSSSNATSFAESPLASGACDLGSLNCPVTFNLINGQLLEAVTASSTVSFLGLFVLFRSVSERADEQTPFRSPLPRLIRRETSSSCAGYNTRER